jgi:hypothetical protein
MSKYDLTPGDKRRIMFNRRFEANYQAIKRSLNERLYSELTDEEEAEWKLSQRLAQTDSQDKPGKNAKELL